MPGYDTHYVFGTNAYLQIKSESVKAIIKTYRQNFTLGLFGPDIFFYSVPEHLRSGINTGSLLHTTNSNLLFKNMYRFASSQPNAERTGRAIAYMCGFLAHYSLDRYAHPFVYARTGYEPNAPKDKHYLDKHFQLETDLDILTLKKYFNKTPKDFIDESRVRLSLNEIGLISEMVQFAINQTFEEFSVSRLSVQTAILSIKTEQRLIKRCPDGLREYINKAETRLAKGHFVSSLIPGTAVTSYDPFNENRQIWANPWSKDLLSDESFPMLMDKAREALLEIYDLLEKTIINTPRLQLKSCDNEAVSDMLSVIGNYSYHSNLDANGS